MVKQLLHNELLPNILDNNFRMASWWITWKDLDWPSSDNLDRIKIRADQMAVANVNVATVFGSHFRWDFMPIWETLHSYMATVTEELHKRNILFFDHHSAVLVHRYDTREEMLNVKMHSGPHLPFSPSRRAAASWKFKGRRLNDWRMRNALTGEILYLPQYTAEQFCYNNPEFIESYLEYVKELILETGIDGIMCDDAIHFLGYFSCVCACCRKQFRERFGFELPGPHDRSFWANWNNPAWNGYIDMRFKNNGDFLEKIRSILPPGFPMMSCCSGSNHPFHVNTGQDVRQFSRACNLVHLEMCGNTPPWRGEGACWSPPVVKRLTEALHHLGVARQRDCRCIGQGYGFTEATAGIIWALNKTLGADCWFSTLKGRLGLPDSIISKLPDDASPASVSFSFEKAHPELFSGKPLFQLGIYFSYETRNHSFFGSQGDGMCRDVEDTQELFFSAGLGAETVVDIPENVAEYSLLIFPSVAMLTDAEIAAMRSFVRSGGVILATGPLGFGEAADMWDIPMQSKKDIWTPGWMEGPVKGLECPAEWREMEKGIFWNPSRIQDDELSGDLLKKATDFIAPLPFKLIASKGFLMIPHYNQNNDSYCLHFLSAEYDVEIDKELDRIRFHRSRVNLITKSIPTGTDGVIELESNFKVEAFSPLNKNAPKIEINTQFSNHSPQIKIDLPQDCCYTIVRLKPQPKKEE